jgi:hypothetical protein
MKTQKTNPRTDHTQRPLRRRGGILLISCYELGQQPLGPAIAAAVLEEGGFAPILLDISVDPFDGEKASRAGLIGISVPMHTALRLGVRAAEKVRALNPHCHISFFGLYAALNADYLVGTVADSCFGAEFETPLLELAESLDAGLDTARFQTAPLPHDVRRPQRAGPHRRILPRRDGLPPLHRYVKLEHEGELRNVGYIAATRGCKHLCTHCPIPPLYNGRFYAVPRADVLEDIGRVVASGARHITFADPDFLNGPAHARRIARETHAEYPDLTFDYTAKIEHLLEHRRLVRELHEMGCIFVVSAVESMSDRTLASLRKGHTRADALTVIRFFRDSGMTLRPSLMPFTPWDGLGDYIELLNIAEGEGLIDQIDAVQYSIRLLVPPGSHLLKGEAMRPFLGPLDAANFAYRWQHPDARMDALHENVRLLVSTAAANREDAMITFHRIKERALSQHHGGRVSARAGVLPVITRTRERPPRLTEAWFC